MQIFKERGENFHYSALGVIQAEKALIKIHRKNEIDFNIVFICGALSTNISLDS